MELDKQINEALKKAGFVRPLTISQMLGAWEQLVELCEEGYDMGFAEFDNDLTARDAIEAVLNAKALADTESVASLRQEAAKLDERYRKLLQAGVEIRSPELSWWRRGVLKRAGSELADDYKSLHGVDVAVVAA